jgi:hypothetical protein
MIKHVSIIIIKKKKSNNIPTLKYTYKFNIYHKREIDLNFHKHLFSTIALNFTPKKHYIRDTL